MSGTDLGPAVSTEDQLITVRIGGQLFGLPIAAVREVFVPEQITRVPLAPAEIGGVLNLRGRIVTMIDLTQLLGLPRAEGAGKSAVGVEHRGEAFGPLIDEVGDVLNVDHAQLEPCPPNLDPRWAEIVNGVYRVAGEMMLVVSIERALARVTAAVAA